MNAQNETSETRITNYGIFCTVSGGRTGYRTAWYKDETGAMPWKGTKAEAEAKAAELNRTMNSGIRTANFSYQAMER